MKKAKREKLEGAGWRVGSAEDFLELSKEEAAFVEMKLALADSVRRRRQARKLTQTQLAKMVGSSQSRIAKMEVGDPSVSIDLLMKTLLTMGASRTELARVISRRKSKARAA
ncbi:MAG: helix-turn-helix domain-containing protein [Deltaproteobacteria bacterium]|nr:helix-turn-helix domain-containing protein [Deltaproteobacteria bacterium]MBW2499710.1 helix-turn-helix domain-containing protein [Deltaproteobacteria bacterium]